MRYLKDNYEKKNAIWEPYEEPDGFQEYTTDTPINPFRPSLSKKKHVNNPRENVEMADDPLPDAPAIEEIANRIIFDPVEKNPSLNDGYIKQAHEPEPADPSPKPSKAERLDFIEGIIEGIRMVQYNVSFYNQRDRPSHHFVKMSIGNYGRLYLSSVGRNGRRTPSPHLRHHLVVDLLSEYDSRFTPDSSLYKSDAK